MIVISLFLLFIASFLLQEFYPAVVALVNIATGASGGEFTHHARVLFIPAFFFAALLAVSFPGMLLLAFIVGLAWDSVNALIWTEGSPGFGSGPLLFALFGAIMHGSRDMYLRGKWVLPLLLGGACVFLLQVFEYLWINFRAGDFYFPPGLWIKISLSAIFTTLILPVYFVVLRRSPGESAATIKLPYSGPR